MLICLCVGRVCEFVFCGVAACWLLLVMDLVVWCLLHCKVVLRLFVILWFVLLVG